MAVAIVTGGAKRIGSEIVKQLHQAGFDIALHFGSSQENAQSLADQLNASRIDSCKTFQSLLGQQIHATELINNIFEWKNNIALLVNNASQFYPTNIASAQEHDWQALFNSNVKGAYFLAQSFAEKIHTQKHTDKQSCIINIVDIYASRPLKRYSIYSMAKASLEMMTKSLALELAPNIRVNAIAPGAILWPAIDKNQFEKEMLYRIPLQQLGSPKDIAECVLFLTKAQYITGETIKVDGGYTLT